jgi:hypothetical protein
MGFFLRLAKLKAYWALITGFFTLIVIPITRYLLRQKKAEARSGEKVVDASFEEIKK